MRRCRVTWVIADRPSLSASLSGMIGAGEASSAISPRGLVTILMSRCETYAGLAPDGLEAQPRLTAMRNSVGEQKYRLLVRRIVCDD